MHGRTTSAIRSDRTPAPLLPRFTSPLFLALIVGLSSCGDGGTTTSEPEAVFFTLLVELAGHGEGTVTSQPAGIACGPEADQCQASFEEGTAVNLSAAPEERSEFLGWSGPCSGGGSCSLTMTGDASVGAEFDNPFLEVEEVGPAGGTVVSSDGQLTLEIPEGALSQGVEITVEALEPEMLGSEFDAVAAELGIAAAYRFGPSGTAFDEPVTVSMPVADAFQVDDDGNEGIEVSLLVASDGSTLEGVGQMELVADAAGPSAELRGELTHFSDLIRGRWGRTLVPIIDLQCPRTLVVGDTCDAEVTILLLQAIEEAPDEFTGGTFTDRTEPPLVLESGDPELAVLEVLLFAALRGSFTYRCAEIGQGAVSGDAVVRLVPASAVLPEIPVAISLFSSDEAFAFFGSAQDVECVPPPRHTLTVTITGDGAGRVTSDPEGIDCHSSGGDCQGSYELGTEVDLTAEPDEGSVFVGWVDADGEVIETSATVRVEVTDDGTVRARFDPVDDDDGEVDPDQAPRVLQLRATLNVPVTTYEVAATDPAGGNLSYVWSMMAREGHDQENCGTPKVPWTQEGQSVTWSHGDYEEEVNCQHQGTDHAVDLTVTVTSSASGLAVRCEMFGSGTQTINNPNCELVEPQDEAPAEVRGRYPVGGH